MKRRIASCLMAATILGSCGAVESPPATSLPSDPVSAAPPSTAAPTRTPDAGSPTASPSTTTVPASPWEPAGDMELGRGDPHAVLLAGGRVLVVGNDETGCVRDDTVQAETWDPGTRTWSPAAGLNQPRGGLTMAALPDGRAIVVGGANAGNRWQTDNQAFSSTWLFDPANPGDGWAKTGLLHAARIMPSTVALQDGRVLVLGGYFAAGREGATGVTLAAWRPGGGDASSPVQPGDVDPGPYNPALATAELYSPATGEWTRTGPMRFARIEPAATRLADGRVLVVGSRQDAWIGDGWTTVDERAPVTAEIYDPSTGTFASLGRLPDVDWSPVADMDIEVMSDEWDADPIGQLLALPDGDALLVEAAWSWLMTQGGDVGRLVRLLRFDAGTGTWAVVDTSLTLQSGEWDDPLTEIVAGHVRTNAMLAVLPDGRVLVAGGMDSRTIEPTDRADLYDPATDTWTPLPPMLEVRADGAVVPLPDGSVLLVGGRGVIPTTADEETDCGEGRTGLASTERFVPGR